MGKKRGSTVQAVEKLAQPIAEELGLELWDICYLKEGAQWVLRIYIDKPGGVSIDDCEAMSRAIDGPLDELDPIEGSYSLEVSSPGVERELSRREHFEKCIGMRVAVRLFKPLEDNRRELSGVLTRLNEDDTFVLSVGNEMITLPRKVCTRIYLDDFGGF